MNTKHTPGPWVLRDGTPLFRVVGGEHRTTVAGDISNDANARLIAAAPDLLAALEAIEAYEDSEPAPGTREAEISAMRRAAIAKATGSA
jgi:hypothetical protein